MLEIIPFGPAVQRSEVTIANGSLLGRVRM